MEAARSTFLNLSPEKQDRVLAAALGEFSDKGYQQASVNTMVSALGIAKGSIYQYFKDKKSLFLYIFDFAIGMVRRTLLVVKEETREENFFARLEKSLLAGVAFIQRHPRVYGLYLKILFDQHVPRRQELLRAVRQFAAEYLGSLVRQGQALPPVLTRDTDAGEPGVEELALHLAVVRDGGEHSPGRDTATTSWSSRGPVRRGYGSRGRGSRPGLGCSCHR